MRSISVGAVMALILLAGCEKKQPDAAASSSTGGSLAAESDDRIACATNDAPLAPDCTIAQQQTARGLVLTLSHPDGHFRRLLVTTDGRGVIAADGAERAKVTMLDANRIEVALAGDRYVLPAHAGSASRR